MGVFSPVFAAVFTRLVPPRSISLTLFVFCEPFSVDSPLVFLSTIVEPHLILFVGLSLCGQLCRARGTRPFCTTRSQEGPKAGPPSYRPPTYPQDANKSKPSSPPIRPCPVGYVRTHPVRQCTRPCGRMSFYSRPRGGAGWGGKKKQPVLGRKSRGCSTLWAGAPVFRGGGFNSVVVGGNGQNNILISFFSSPVVE